MRKAFDVLAAIGAVALLSHEAQAFKMADLGRRLSVNEVKQACTNAGGTTYTDTQHGEGISDGYGCTWKCQGSSGDCTINCPPGDSSNCFGQTGVEAPRLTLPARPTVNDIVRALSGR